LTVLVPERRTFAGQVTNSCGIQTEHKIWLA
jgi:hypothetical protein